MAISDQSAGPQQVKGETGVSPERSALMARIGPRDTKPEMIVRRIIHALGYRFHLHRRDLPGTPDLVFPRLRKVVFVHGCFWHRHTGCKMASNPKTREDFWREKFSGNIERDARKEAELRSLGWDVLVVWECETKSAQTLAVRFSEWLGDRGGGSGGFFLQR